MDNAQHTEPPSPLALSALNDAAGVPVVFFVAVELVMRVAGYGYNPDFFLKLDIGGKPFFVQNEDFSRRFFPPETMRQPSALRMRAETIRSPRSQTSSSSLGLLH